MAASASAPSPWTGNQIRRPNRTFGSKPCAANSYTLDLRNPSCSPTSEAFRNTRLLSSVCPCPLLCCTIGPSSSSRVTMICHVAALRPYASLAARFSHSPTLSAAARRSPSEACCVVDGHQLVAVAQHLHSQVQRHARASQQTG